MPACRACSPIGWSWDAKQPRCDTPGSKRAVIPSAVEQSRGCPEGAARAMSYQSILIIKPSSLGDIVHTLPAVAAIREANPDAKITWVINPEWAPLLRGNRDIDHVHIFPRGEFRGLGAPAQPVPWLKKTRALRPDVAVDFQGLLRSALIARISGARELFGLSDAREGSRFFYHHIARVDRRAPCRRSLSQACRNVRRAHSAGRCASRCRPATSCRASTSTSRSSCCIRSARGRGKSLSDRTVREFCESCAPTRVVVVGKVEAARQSTG